jgi:hypothetical protein
MAAAPDRDPYYYRRTPLAWLADLLIVALAILLVIWALAYDTWPLWMVRLSWAGAIVAGFALSLHALRRIVGRP